MPRERSTNYARPIGPGSRRPLPAGLVFGIALLASIGACIWALLGQQDRPPTFVSTLANETVKTTPGPQASATSDGTISPDVQTVALWTDLFPKPVVPEPELPSPQPVLAVELRALVNPLLAGGYAFVFDPAEKQYLALHLGDEAPGGAVLAAMDEQSATFELNGRHVKQVLDR
ncbi:MAG: hypothetical protein KDA20_05350 [Phycisphaerales bacterium]|nr:hypothetical protein [Phycisphaerales bacterium]